MTATPKLKVSLTISADVMALVDRDARLHETTRSGVVERWLRRAALSSAEREIEAATAAYYRSLRDDERSADVAMSKASSAAARRVSYDEPDTRRTRRASR